MIRPFPALLPALVLGGILACGAAAAQSLNLSPGGGSSGPIEVLADNGIEWQQSQRRFTARGNAVASRGDVSVRADQLVASYRETEGGGTDISRLEAHGGVRISSPTQTATGTSAVYDLDTGRVELLGSPARLVTPNETLTANERLTYDTVKGIATAQGGATIEQGGRVLRAPTLEARLVATADGGTALSTVEARGGVEIITPSETAHGSQGNYDANSGIATLTGSVRIVRGDNVLTGSKAIVNLRTGVSTLQGGGPADAQGGTGRARAILNPEGERR
ncbi:LptA/OstA family protein [Novispirillum sp. DQ9]|uniref:LptA/OstA family protein n=1 Tax=Novispirillum sp. DQ9 TaxID=3398612 RepID=UPI003C7E5EE0